MIENQVSDKKIDENLKDLLQKMLELDPHKRITIEGIKMHPWYLD